MLFSHPEDVQGWFHAPILSEGGWVGCSTPGWLIQVADLVAMTHPNTILGWRSLGSRRNRAEFMFPHLTACGKGLGVLPSPSFLITESQRRHQAVGTRRGLMPTPGGKSRGWMQKWACRETAVHGPRRTLLGTPPWVLGAAGTQSRGGRHPQRAQCAAQGPPCSAGTGSPQDGREEPDPAPAGAPLQRQGGSRGSPARSCWPAVGAGVPAGAYAPG